MRDQDGSLTEDELTMLAATVLTGGFLSTTNQITLTFLCLLRHPDQLAVVAAFGSTGFAAPLTVLAERSADATARLSGHLLEPVRAIPVLTVFRRAAAQADAVHRVGEAHRKAAVGTLRVAFLSALVLELLATLSVALVAVVIGVRLVGGDFDLATGLLVLVLAPECYLPLRAAGAAHHASEDGQEAVRRVDQRLHGLPQLA